VLAAVGAVPREAFVAPELRHLAYRNAPLPIGEQQTISQPFVVAFMLQELQLSGDEKVLEIGTGSGYQTAILARLARRVVSIERIEVLAERATVVLGQLGIENCEVHVANGSLGWPEQAPYDAIVVSAASPDVPDALSAQLAEGGRLILPVGSLTAQELMLVRRRGGQLHRENRGPVRFVPLIGEEGWGGASLRG
jgi:protein-L-isoaspartate(D-aspartate) O-methyltransferase